MIANMSDPVRKNPVDRHVIFQMKLTVSVDYAICQEALMPVFQPALRYSRDAV